MKKFYVTGTSRGIGRAITEILLSNPQNEVTGISRSNTVKHERFQHLPLDLSDVENLSIRSTELFKSFVSSSPEQVVLINNAGYLGQIQYLGDLETDEFIRVFNTNSIAPAILMNAFIRQFRHADCSKVILNIGSGAGRHPYDGWGAYCASKAALDMLSQVADMENRLRKEGFRIVSLAPGPVNTEMQEVIRNTPGRDFSQKGKFNKLRTSGQLPEAREIAQKIVHFLDTIDDYKGTLLDIRKMDIT